mmetsp:Transcript_33985/g.38676  ORF Transcript_33985/g.38676 Transcript_33985/m.38676 type:complete len:91 (-) Transcript_33985:1024-1296(-)
MNDTTDNSDDINKISSSEEDESNALANCLLSQFWFFGGGVGLGLAGSLKLKKGPAPMIIGGVAGSLADLIYGYTVACKEHTSTNKKEEEN